MIHIKIFNVVLYLITVLIKDWDNKKDTIYDNWQEKYSVQNLIIKNTGV